MGVHAGRPLLTDEGYVDLSVHAVARICAAAHGGQILVSKEVRDALAGGLASGARLRSIGEHRLGGLPSAIGLYQLCARGLSTAFPGLRGVAKSRAARVQRPRDDSSARMK
jgi:class 3 adenylate cyclase